jgi:hypothetical protein
MRCVGELIRHAHQYGLARILSLGTAGRFCHHLRERQTAGLVVQRLRNGLRCARGLVMACVVLVAAAQGCVNVGGFAA